MIRKLTKEEHDRNDRIMKYMFFNHEKFKMEFVEDTPEEIKEEYREFLEDAKKKGEYVET